MAKLSESTINNYASQVMDYYVEEYEKKYRHRPVEFNRNAAKYNFREMIKDIGKPQAIEVIDFFFSLSRAPHKVNDLVYKYEELMAYKEELDENAARIDKLTKETRERRRRYEQDRATGSKLSTKE